MKQNFKFMARMIVIASFSAMTASCSRDEPTLSVFPYDIELSVTPKYQKVKFFAVATKLIVDWGDGYNDIFTNVTEIAHTYAEDRSYTVKIIEEGLTEFGDKMDIYICDDGTGVGWENHEYLIGTIEQITVSSCPALKQLAIFHYYGFDIAAADVIVSNCPALEYLLCRDFYVGSSLTLVGCTALNTLACEYSSLTAFSDLPDRTYLLDRTDAEYYGICCYVRNNPGSATCTHSIARDKYWEVYW
ncbi:MAG: hypothetical protein LBT04_05290 [Prevotellaceae bacterium]|jgi:hypothetical protein|nr:hypothetical protein [Prevotellaceae bacterium]